AHPERGGGVQLHPLRQAARHREDHRQHADQARRPLDVRRARRARSAQDVRRLPRARHDGEGNPHRTRPGRTMSRPEGQTTGLPGPLAPEDRARAGHYALLARLYADAPDAALLSAIAKSGAAGPVETAEHPLARTWTMLGAASAAMDPAAAAEEYQELFVGVGQSAVSLHASAYLPPRG